MHVRSLLGCVIAACTLLGAPARADFNSTLAPAPLIGAASLGFSNSTAGNLTSAGTQAQLPYNFIDQWNFTLGNDAMVGAFAGSFNFVDPGGAVAQGIDNLQLRLVGANGTLVSWQTSVTVASGAEQLFAIVSPGLFAPGNYHLDVRGTLVGAASAYAGTLQTMGVVPVPPASWLFVAGLAAIGLLVRRRMEKS